MREISKRARWLLVGGAVLGFLLAALAFSRLGKRDTWAGAALIVATTGFGVLVHSLIRHQFMMGELVAPRRIALFGAVTAVGLGLVLWWSQASEAPNGVGFWGGVLGFIGLGLAVAELRRSRKASRWVGLGLLVLALAVLGTAGALAAAGEGTLLLPLIFGGVVSLFLALSLLSAVCNRRLKEWPLGRAALLGLIGLLLYGGIVALVGEETGIGADYSWPLFAGLLVFMVATASRSNGDAAVVIIGVMVFFAATPTPKDGPVPPSGNRPVMVALGDSFISGEGADQYFDNTNVKEVNTCRRAPTAHPNRLVTEDPALPFDLVFVACSGAKAGEVYLPTERDEESNRKGLNQVGLAKDMLGKAGIPDANVPFVLLSIGGNDSFFGVIAQACLAPGDCSTLGSAWRENLKNLVEPLRGSYRAVQAAFPGAPVLVVPYPVPIAARECGWTTFTGSEHQFLHAYTLELNSVIERVVAEAEFTRLHYVDTMPSALLDADLAICDGDPDDAGVNFLAVHGVGGLIESSVNPANWIHNSMHPNVRGHAEMRRAVDRWLAGHPDVRNGRPGAARSTPPRPAATGFAPIDPAGRCVAVVRNTPADKDVREALEECTNEWTLGEVQKFATFPGSLVLVMILAAWLAGLGSVRVTRIAGVAALRRVRASRER